MTPPIKPSGKLITPVAFDQNSDIYPLLVDDSGYVWVVSPTNPDYVFPFVFDGSGNLQVVVADNTLDYIQSVAIISDEKANNTNGGTFTSGAWQTRDLNTEDYDPDGIVSIAANQFTLIPGKYLIKAIAPAYEVGQHQARLYDVTAGGVVTYGVQSRIGTTTDVQTLSEVAAYVNISVNTTYRIEHRCSNTKANTGFGSPSNFGNNEHFTQVVITKLGTYTV